MSRLRWLTAGESHGPALVATLEGLPAGVPITTEMVADHLARRRLGYGRGARMKFERDEITFLGGVRHGLTLGSPVAVMVGNTEWPKWEQVMSADPVDPEILAGLARNAPLTRPRPGHADLAGMQKYGFDEARPILERASARETAARVALGAVARSYLKETAGIEIVSPCRGAGRGEGALRRLPHALRRREAGRGSGALPGRGRVEGDGRGDRPGPQGRRHPGWCGRGARVRRAGRASARMCTGTGAWTPGSPPRSWASRRSRASRSATASTSRGCPGRRRTTRSSPPTTASGASTGRSGGTEGGLTTGELLRVRAAMKPIATVPRALADRRRRHR